MAWPTAAARSCRRRWTFASVPMRRVFRFLAAAYGRINSTWTLTNQVGWPQAKELLFTARIVEAEEAYRIGLLNYLVPVYRLREKTMDIATQIATNDTPSVIGIKRLLLQHMGGSLEQQWANERDFTTNVLRGTLAEEAFPEFLARRGPTGQRAIRRCVSAS